MAQWQVERQREMALRPLFEYLERAKIYNQAGLARRLGLTRQRLYAIKTGRRPAPAGFMETVCAEVGISPRQLGKAPTAPILPSQPRRVRVSA